MQTFLPYKDFIKSAQALDSKRLGKQRVEAKQILNALQGRSKGWVHHPATKMWAGYEYQLCQYGMAVCIVWQARGFNDSLLDEFHKELQSPFNSWATNDAPPWLGREDFHLSHQSNLIRKDPEFYIPIFGDIPNDLPYVWPSKEQ